MRRIVAVQVFASILASLSLGAFTTVPLLLSIDRVGWDFGSDYEGDTYWTDDVDGAPEEEDYDWAPIPVRPPKRAEPPKIAEVAPLTSTAKLPLRSEKAPQIAEVGDAVAEVDETVDLEDDEDDDTDVGEMEGMGTDTDDAEASHKHARKLVAKVVKPKKPTKKPPEPCKDDRPEIAEIETDHYSINRSLVDYYTAHLMELEHLVTYVVTHKAESGKADGFKFGLKRCGVLWEAGFRSGDIVTGVNGRHPATVLQAIGTYMALRKDTEFALDVTRRNGKTLVLRYTLLEEEEKTREQERAERLQMREERRTQRAERKAAREER